VLELTHRGRLAVLKMRHGKANTLDTEFCDDLRNRSENLSGSDTGAVILTADGPIFSAGVDLIRALDRGAVYFRDFLPALSKLYEAIFFFPKPVVAAINGHAIAGGCVLACLADRRLMARGVGRIGVTELLVGLPFPSMAFEVMRFATAPRYLQEVILTAATYAPEAALERGLVDEIVDPRALLDRAIEVAEAFAALSPQAFTLSKQQIRQAVRDHLDKHGRKVDSATDGVWLADETQDRIRNYVTRTFKKPAAKSA
jgi:enoyl-CoA hydratase